MDKLSNMFGQDRTMPVCEFRRIIVSEIVANLSESLVDSEEISTISGTI